MKREVLLILAALGVTALGATALGGCKPKAGGSCKIETKEVCIGDKKALACHGGTWEEMSCNGPAGCSGEGPCDQSVAEKDEVCNLSDDYVCTGDKKGMLQCLKNKWTLVHSCLGDRACVMEKKKVTCDNSVANLGDACREEEDYGCTPDRKSAIVCRGGTFVQAILCKGPNGCRVVLDTKKQRYKLECDDSIANVGDACERDKEEHYSCSADERAILRCRGKRFEIEEKCRSKEKCQTVGGIVGCH